MTCLDGPGDLSDQTHLSFNHLNIGTGFQGHPTLASICHATGQQTEKINQEQNLIFIIEGTF